MNPESLMNPQTLELLKKLPKKEYLHLWSSTSRYKLSDSTMEAAQAANAAAEAAAAAISNARQTSSVSPADSTSESDISSASMLQLKRPRIGSRMLMCVSTITKQYKDIVIRSYPNFTQIIVSPTTTGMRHTYNVNVFEEIIDAMRLLMEDSHCKAVMMTGLGRTYSQGVDLTLLTFESVEKQKKSAEHLAHGIRKFVQYLLGYKKLLVAAVNGHAHGLGVTLLPLFDIVYANDKALFTTDYAKIGQIPEAFASVTMAGTGHHSLSEMFLLGRVLTAQEAKDKGLVSAVVWPDKFLEEIVPRIEVLETQVDTKGMEAIKMLMKSRTKRQIAEIADEETKMLVANWTAPDFAKKARQYLKANEQIIFQ